MCKKNKPISYYGYDNFDITFIFEKYKIIQNGIVIYESKYATDDVPETTVHLKDVLYFIDGYDDTNGIIIVKTENLIIIYEVICIIIESLKSFLHGYVIKDEEIEKRLQKIGTKSKINIELTYDRNQFETNITEEY